MRLELLLLGKTKEAYIAAGIKDFSERLGHFCPVTLTYLKGKGAVGKSDTEIMAMESSLLNSRIETQGCYRIALDPSGRQLTSEQLAAYLDSLICRGVKKTVWVIGGPLGLAEEQRQAADLVLSLSTMTFTHDMTRLLLLEQLYRAFSIRAGTGYHK
ncbi:MAG: 23S rRNA (pseudouridine(1915)-N(3))-methyltransferase RlmH [Desulfofustis sp.]|nr:23S rRNA (pseudouridine(1915)-N(3))-methyltransferase RlmH [Desulfofustis sp.]